MKDIIIIVSLFVLVLNASNNLRNLLLGKDPVKYAVLIDAANQTFYQMYNLTLNFRDRYEAMVNDSQKRLRVIVDEYDPLIPPSSPNVTFTVINGKPQLNDILKDLSNLYEINDTDLKEIRSYLTHMTGKYSNLKRVLKNNDIDPISKRIMLEEMKEKAELKKHYKVIGAESHE